MSNEILHDCVEASDFDAPLAPVTFSRYRGPTIFWPLLGGVRRNVVPLASDDTSSKSPSCANAISRQRLKPSPAPPDCRSRESLTRKKRSKAVSAFPQNSVTCIRDQKTALRLSRRTLAWIQPALTL